VAGVTKQASDQAREFVEQAQSRFQEQAASQAQKAAGGLRDVSQQVRALSEGKAENAGFAADGARQIADKIGELAGRVDERGFDGTVEDLRQLARRRPGLFLLSAAATGFVVGRLGRGLQAANQQSSAPADGHPQSASATPAVSTTSPPAGPGGGW
jgi:hypothetical protein